MNLRLLPLLLLLTLGSRKTHAHGVANELALAATNFLAALTPEQRSQATFELADPERLNWHFVPRARKGLAFRELTPTQQLLAQVLLATPLSQRGHYEAATIMSLEHVLYELQNHAPMREPGQYSVSIFGTPGGQSWGFRIEGHHLSLNFLVANGGAIATSPAFFGTNPAEVRSGPRAGLRVLAREEDLARQLVSSLNARQSALAIIATNAPDDIITGTNRNITALTPAGIPAAKLDSAQAALLRELLETYVRRYRAELAEVELQKIDRAGAGKLFFAWAGSIEQGQRHYYRLQGPHFIVEYDNVQNNANHVHTVWRDLQNDFGDDLLKRHYEQTPHPR